LISLSLLTSKLVLWSTWQTDHYTSTSGCSSVDRVRNARGILQGNLLFKTGFERCSFGAAGRDLTCQAKEALPKYTLFFYNKLSPICGCSSVDRALPCQGRGHEFKSRHPHQFLLIRNTEIKTSLKKS
jgi:hypothetical protein